MANHLLQIATTTDSREVAERIARELVERRLAACVQISGPVTSVYRWKGAVETAEEYVCTVKTTEERFADVEALVCELHPYDTPELIATTITQASSAYENWLRNEVA